MKISDFKNNWQKVQMYNDKYKAIKQKKKYIKLMML